MFPLIRAVAARLPLPGRGVHRHRPYIAAPAPQPAAIARPLRAHRAPPYVWTDDGPLLRPYVLDADEWTRRRRESRTQTVGAAP